MVHESISKSTYLEREGNMAEKRNYLQVVADVCRVFGTTTDRDKILHMIVGSAVEKMQAKAACLFMPTAQNQEYKVVAQKGLSQKYLRRGIGNVENIPKILLRKGYIYYPDVTVDTRLEKREEKRVEGLCSMLIIPVMVSGQIIGVLCIYTDKIKKFSETQIEFLSILAEQGGMAIENARLVEKIRENTKLFLDLAASISSSLDVKTILQTLTKDISKAIGVKAASIRLLDEERKILKLVASYGLSQKYLNKGPISAEKSIAEALKGNPVVVKNAKTDKGVQYKEEKAEEGIESILCVPIKSKNAVIGVFRLYSAEQRIFTDDEVMLVTALASQGGLAIQNASLYLMLKQDMKDLQDDIWSYRCWF
jgi:GAF domain-containing protein